MSSEHPSDAPTPAAPDPRDQLVLDEARRGIDQQKDDLQSLRTRAGTAIGFSTVVASVCAGLALRNDASPTTWAWTGLVALAVAALLSVFVLMPRTFTLSLDVEEMDQRIDAGDSVSTMMRDTSLALHRDHETNDVTLKRMHKAYLFSLAAVLAELALLLTDLARR